MSDATSSAALTRAARLRARLFAPGAFLVAAAVLLLLLFGGGRDRANIDNARNTAFQPIFLPIYEIEAVSGSHNARILNLPLPYIGAPQVPIPVDINGDLLPDVTFAVNLINAEGIFNNPPNLGQVIAPNIDINRLITAPILTPGGDPLRINLKFTVQDLSGENPNIVVRYGYDTGPGGTIPPNYKAVVSGLNTLFNPITARIDTTGGLVIGLDPKLPDLGLVPQTNAYEGPLTTWAALDTGPALRVNADMRFQPMPSLLELTYGTQDATQQITLAHVAPREIDFRITGHIEMTDADTGSKTTADLTAGIDRLPRQVAVDFATAGDEGAVRYETDSGPGVRNPDLRATIDMRQDNEPPLIARVDMESLPDLITANWLLPDNAPPTVVFDASGQGIGAIEARIQNYLGTPTAFTEWVPGERQHVSIQAGPGGLLEDDTLIQARIERIRHADVTGLPDGTIEGTVNIGDGERPLEIHGEIDLRGSSTDPEAFTPYVNATATLSPLPDQIDFSLTPTSDEDPTRPMRVEFTPSETMDIDVNALIGLPETVGDVECGDGGTACANLEIRNVPTNIVAEIANLETESRILIDMVPRPGAAPLDIFGNVTLGPVDADGDPIIDLLLGQPVYADFAIVGLPEHVSVRMLENEAGDLERMDVRPCQLDFGTGLCTDPEGEIAEVTFGVRNWLERPSNLPAAPQSGPLYVTAVARGVDPGTEDYKVLYEATGRVTDIRGLTYISAGDLTAARVDIGGNQDMRLYVDADDIDINGDDAGGLIDVDADVRVESLPAPFVFCFAETGRPIPTDGPIDPITERCESTDPFGDGTVTEGPGPLTIAYDAPAPFSAHADIVIAGDLPIELPEAIPLDFGDFNRVAAQLDVTNIPSDFTAYVGSPADVLYGDDLGGNVATATRVRTVAPGATLTNIQLGAQITTEGADCADPNTVGGAICADVEIDSLPDYASVLFATLTDPGPDTDPDVTSDDEVIDTQVEFHACDRQFFAAVPSCLADTDGDVLTAPVDTSGEIGVIDVDLRAHAGGTASVPAYVPPNSGPLLYAVGDLDDFANFELQAGLRIEELREIVFRKNTEEMHANTDVGDGIEPLRVHVYLDTRDAASILDNEFLRAQAVADITLDPLPQQVTFDQSGPGQNQASPTIIDLTASETSVLTVNAEVRQEGVAEGAECGVRGTYCAEIEVDSLPNVIHAQIDRDASAPVDPVTNTRPTQNQIHVDQTRFPGQGPEDKADITVHAAVGLPFEAPIVGDGPLFADLVLTGVPDHISMAMDSLEVIDPTSGDAILDASTLERFQVHTCNRNFATEVCEDNSVSPLDQLDASVRSFDLRPTDFPAPPSVADAPFYIGASGRGNLLEAVARFTEVSEVQFLNRGGMTAATAKAGGGADFQVRVDIEDLPLGSITQTLDLGFIEIADPSATIKATVDITPFPGDLSFCMREGGLAMPGDSPITFTDTCEQTDPFDTVDPLDDDFTDDGGLTHTPLSIGFDANTSFDVNVDAEVAIDGVNPTTLAALPQQRAFGRLALEDLPSDLALHFLQPVPEATQADPAVIETSGPYHGILRTPGATSGLDITLAAGYLVGADTVCEDPRPNRSATCVSMGEFGGTPGIENLPTDAEFFYNPDLDPYSLTEAQLVDPAVMTNFTIHTEGTAATEFNKLRISTVNPPLDLPAVEVPLLGELATDAFIAELDLDPLPDPFDVRGTLLLTDESPTATFEVLDGPTPGVDAIPGATVHLQNFLSPDPTTGVEVPPRPVEDVYAPPNQTYTISAIQRGPAVRVDAQIPRVQSFGIRPVRSGEDTSSLWRHPMGTTVINAGFEGDFNIRAYADLQPNPGLRIIGDVLIGDIPRETDVCIRGPRETDPVLVTPLPYDDLPIPGTGTWCDDPANIEPGEGGLEIAQTPNTFGRKMDIDAFARLEFGGGSSVIAGRVDIRQMPQVIRGRFGGSSGKDFELSMYEYADALGNLSPAGINRISFEAASFDLADSDTGYLAGQLPYSPQAGALEAKDAPGGGGTFGGPTVTTEFLHAAADLRGGTDLANIGFHVRGQIGLDDSNVDSARLSHLLFSGDPCEVPVIGGNGVNQNDPRGDYPDIPENDPAGYTCIRTDFFEDTGSDPNPLLLDAIALLPGDTAVRLHDAGISDLPEWIQVQLAEAETFTDPTNQRGWRRPCPSIDDNRPGGCMAPLMRFDQPATSFLFGQAEFGRIADFGDFDLPSTDPVMPAPDFDALPNGADWANNPTSDSPDVGDRNNYDTGIRAKVLLYDGNTPLDFADDRIAARAGLRIQIPGSIQVEQIQNFDLDLRQKNQDGEYIGGDKASDMRMAFTTRLPGGALQESIGDLAAMVHMVDSGAQILLTQPCPSTEDILDDQETEARVPCAEYNDGIPLPGHVAMTMYLRNHLENVDVGPDGDDKLRSSTFVQIDGRISTEMNIGARLYGNGVALLSGGPTEGVFTGDGAVTAGTAEIAIRNLPSSGSTLGAHVYDPDFRFRAEILSDGDRPTDDPDPSTFSESGEVSEENDCNPDLPPEHVDGCLNEWFEFNFTYNVGIERAFVAFDMHPANSATGPAKSLDAVIHLNTPQIGADLQAWDNIDRSGPAEISLGVGVAISPLNFEVKSHSNVGANLDALVHRFITETIGGPDWLADIIGFIIKPITALIDAILNSLPIGIELESDFYLQFSVDRLDRFTLRNNILHAMMDGEGNGYANFGPINWYIDKFSGGLYFDVPNISIPDWICWVPGIPCNINPPAILLLGYGYADGFPIGSLGIPILMDFRDCDALGGVGSILPFAGGGLDNTVSMDPGDPDPITSFFTGGDDEDFVMWVGTDPRMSFGGLLFRALDLITFGGFTTALDFVLDLLVGPIVCNIDFFSVDQEDNQFVGINHSGNYGSPAYYHPGMPDANKFPGHPVPGQPGVDNVLAEADETPPAAPVPEPPNDPSAPPPTPTPPDPPTDGLPDLYSGPTGVVSANTAMCGVHEFDSFTVNTGITVSVATAANGDTSLGTGPACAASEVGYLEIRANTITVDGTINADFISDDIPDLVPEIPVLLDGDGNPIVFDPPLASPQDFEALYRATGNSGGTNAGVGANGTVPEAGFQNYEGGTEDTTVYQGGPGSSVGTGYDLDGNGIAPTVPGLFDSAGAGGNGGGTVVLLADTGITVNGLVTADGQNGVGDTFGLCDDNPDDFNGPGIQTYDHDSDTNTAEIPRPILDPDYEHTGHIGSGGGAGGGIALEAEHGPITLGAGAVLSAQGGSGGTARLGAGGGGGGGAVKVIAPVLSGVTTSKLQVEGGANGSSASLCIGVPGATAQTFDNPTTVPVETGVLPHDGVEVTVERAYSELKPYGPFWWAGGANVPAGGDLMDTYYNLAATSGSTVYVCAVRVPVGSTYDAITIDDEVDIPYNFILPLSGDNAPWDESRDDNIPFESDSLATALSRVLPYEEIEADILTGTETLIPHGDMPDAADPCGDPVLDAEHRINAGPSGPQLVQVGSFTPGTTLVHGTPAATTLDIDSTFLYGLYTVVVRGGVVRSELHGVEWALGVDATVPNVEIISPVDTPTPSQNSAGVTVTYVADDILVAPRYLSGPGLVAPFDVFEDAPTQFILSGLNRTECSIDGGAFDRCFSGETHVLTQPDGVKVINVRSFDDAASNVPDGGLVSNLTDDVDADGRDGVVDVILAIDPPESDIELTGGTTGGSVTAGQLLDPGDAGAAWYRVAPGMRIFDYSSAAPSAATPYVYRFDNGSERGCENHALPYDDTPPDCVLTGTEIDDLLTTGGHSIHSTAVNETGNRYRDDTDLTTASPMDRQPVYLDTEDPFVEFTTIPLEEDETFGGNPWFGEQVVPFVSAIDQFGGSGVTSIGYRFGLFGAYTPFDINNPPPVPSGENVFCYQVFDLAGNETSDCEDIREDGDVPTVNLDTVGGTLGDGSETGWWVAAPGFEANTYDDDVPTGVGIDSGHFRTRVDNGSVVTCSAPSCGFGSGLTTGTHLVHVAAVDRFGNLSGESTEEVLVDLEPPLIAPVIGPADPDGENGWWHSGPYLTLFADDPGDGSGVDPATLEYSLTGSGGPWIDWTAPVHVAAGEHTLCWRVSDKAGNDSVETGVPCASFFVDLDNPVTTITSPADPLPNGWFGADVLISAGSTDTVPGSGFGAADPDDVCEDLTPAPAATNIAGTCVSVDGGPYLQYVGAITAGEGVHTVRSYSIDRSGRRSAVAERIVRIDKSRPVVELRRLPKDPAELVNNWYRVRPLIVLRADDGYDGSGVQLLEYKVDSGPWTVYTRPFELGENIHTVQTRATDMVGQATTSTQVKVDLTHPSAQALAPQKILWLRLLGLGGPNNLNFRVGDNLSGRLQVTVIVYDVTGMPIRKLVPTGTITVAPGGFYNGFVTWDGKDGSLLNLVPLGIYYYRVVVVDEAGHVAHGGESPRITIRLL